MENARPLPRRFRRRNPRPLEQSIPYDMSVSWSKVGKRLSTRGFNDPVSFHDKIVFIFGKTGVLKDIMGKWRIIKRTHQEDLIVHELHVTLEHEWMMVKNEAIRIGILACSTPTNGARTYVTLYLHKEDIPGGIKEDIPRDKISIKTLRNKFKALVDDVNAAAVPVDAAVPVEEMNVLHLKL